MALASRPPTWHVFDRFYRAPTAEERPGSGLGLAIVAQTVARYGGTTFAHNNDGPGATVGFELPAVTCV